MYALFFEPFGRVFDSGALKKKLNIFRVSYSNLMKLSSQKTIWLKFGVLDFRDFLPNGLEVNGLKVGPVFLWSPCTCVGAGL